MSFVDLATLTMHRRNEMEVRIANFLTKCDQAVQSIAKLKLQAQGFTHQLNCEPSQLKERFLKCMKQLDEYIYLITDFNLAYGKLEEMVSMENTPVHDTFAKLLEPTPAMNLFDILSDARPSTSTACSNRCPTEKPKRVKVPKKDQVLIAFSSSSNSSESIAMKMDKVKEIHNVVNGVKSITLKEPPTPVEQCNLPAQTVLQTDQVYPATIMNINGSSFWVITDSTEEAYKLMVTMTQYYKSNSHQSPLQPEEVASLTYCAYYDQEEDCYYRGLFIRLSEDEVNTAEVFLVDTGEERSAPLECIRPLAAPFFTQPPFARCCHLAGVELLSGGSAGLIERQDQFMKQFIGWQCTIEIDDNSSESLGVIVRLTASNECLNEILVQEGLAVNSDNRHYTPHTPPGSPPGLVDEDLDITSCPEYEDPVEAVTGYHNKDEADICKHYKGGPEKTCFKGSRCTKRHVMMHPDGWTLDRVEVQVRLKTYPLPAPNTWHKVHVTCVCHFDRIFVQFVKEKVKDEAPAPFGLVVPPTSLESLVRDMNSPAARQAYKPLKMAPAAGEIVAAMYPLDEQWYRARVVTVTRPDRSVEVMYVDYGNVVWVREDAIRVLEARFAALPMQAVLCRLAGVVARTKCSRQWAAAKDALQRRVQDRTLDAHIIARNYDELHVELYDQDGYSVAEQLAVTHMVEFNEYKVQDDTNVPHKVVVP